MQHENSRRLLAYWNHLRGGAPAPRRCDVEPADMRQILGDAFILETEGDGTARFRLAGTRLCATFGRELKASEFLDLWPEAGRRAVGEVLSAVAARAAGFVIESRGRNERGQTVAFEILLLPLRSDGPAVDRILGAMTALDAPYWLGSQPVAGQTISGLKLLTPGERVPTRRPRLRLVTNTMHPLARVVRRSAFLVHQGGKI